MSYYRYRSAAVPNVLIPAIENWDLGKDLCLCALCDRELREGGVQDQPAMYLAISTTGHRSVLTLLDTVSLFSWKFIMASDIFTSMGSTTISMLKGPSRRSATFSTASEGRFQNLW